MRIVGLKGLHVHTCILGSFKPGFIVPNKLIIAVYLPSIYSSSKGTSGQTHQTIQGSKFWADQRVPQLNVDENQEDPEKKEHTDGPVVQPVEKNMIQSNQEDSEPDVSDTTQTDPLKIVHLDLKGAAPKVTYLKEVGISVCKLECVSNVCV